MSEREGSLKGMSIDAEMVSNIIISFIRDRVERERKDGVLLGLSGGIDSAVVATLASLAIGYQRVYAMYLFDRDSEKRSLEYARMLAVRLGVNFEAHHISELAGRLGISGRPATVTPFPAVINRLFHAAVRFLYYRFYRQDPFVLILRQEEPGGIVPRMLYRFWLHRTEEGFNMKHRLRRAILEDCAKRRNLLLLGAANKTESMIGWFVKDGVDDLPVEPIMGLYKSQVRQLARFLDLPHEIVEITPSPDMARGITDEMIIGFRYEKLDAALYVIESGSNPETAYRAGLTPHEFESIMKLNALSAWKRTNPHEYPKIN